MEVVALFILNRTATQFFRVFCGPTIKICLVLTPIIIMYLPVLYKDGACQMVFTSRTYLIWLNFRFTFQKNVT